MKNRVVLFAAAAVFGLGPPARSELTVYTTRAEYLAATTDNTVIDFAGLAPPSGSTFYGSPGHLEVGGATFDSSGPMFVQNDGTTSRLSFQQDTPTNELDVTLPSGMDSAGFDYEAGTELTLLFFDESGSYLDFALLDVVSYPNFDFIGFVVDQPIGYLTLVSTGGGDLKNFTFGHSIVPEPGTLGLVGCGGLGLLGHGVRRRRRRGAAGAGQRRS